MECNAAFASADADAVVCASVDAKTADVSFAAASALGFFLTNGAESAGFGCNALAFAGAVLSVGAACNADTITLPTIGAAGPSAT